jgi:hypothetical protein
MLSSVLGSKRAIEVNSEIMRAFGRLRHILAANVEFAHKLDVLEARLKRDQNEKSKRNADHEKHIRAVFETLRHHLDERSDDEPPSRIGFDVKRASACQMVEFQVGEAISPPPRVVA